jgi:hypothetical protein
MEVQLVRSAHPACEPDCPEWIAAQGRIDASSLTRFKRVLARLGNRQLPVLIDSPGGSVTEALAIGRLIRAKGLDIVVTKTVLSPCPPKDQACRRLMSRGVAMGLPEARLSKCASACAFLLAGGVRRYIGAGAFVGVHAIAAYQIYARVVRTYRITTQTSWGVPISTSKELVRERKISEKAVSVPTPAGTYAELARYFQEMGVSGEVLPIVMRTPHEKIHWFTPAELRSLKVATDLVNGEQLILPARALPAPAATAATRALAPPDPPCLPAAGLTLGCGTGGVPLEAQPAPILNAPPPSEAVKPQ